ncbi:MAG: hypothetical protein LBJ97_03115 [Mycoplasmataceae bacterium]|jgi:hypothetical protein|nr:hypothetical protein [Mycoplasmataceae bacterium]
MKNSKISIIVIMSTNTFVGNTKDIKRICQKYEAREILDARTNTIMFYFYDNELWLKAKREIQLLVVGRINFKPSSKRVIIMDEMKDTIVEPSRPPAWFLEFQKEMREFQKLVMARFDKLDERLNNIVKLNNLKE